MTSLYSVTYIFRYIKNKFQVCSAVIGLSTYNSRTEERINKGEKEKSHPRFEWSLTWSGRKKKSLFPDEKHIWLTSRHIFSQAIAHLLRGCDVSSRFFIYLIVYFQRLQRWVDRIGCKSSHTYHVSHFQLQHLGWHHCLRSLPQACKCQDMENTCQVGKCYLFFSTCQSVSQSVRRGPGRDTARRWRIQYREMEAHAPHCRPDSTSKLPPMKV